MKKFTTAIVLLGTLSGSAFAADTQPADHPKHDMGKPAVTATKATAAADGVIRGIDLKAGTITVEHGPIPSLGMAAMTMPYYVKDPGMLKAVKPGDKVKMSVEVIGGRYTITTLQRAS